MPANAFWTNATIDVLLVIYVLDCAFMGLVIMMQRSKQEGLGAAFGGNLMSEFAGAQASAVLVKATVWAAIIFFVLSICLARLYSSRASMAVPQKSGVQMYLDKSATPTPAATNAAPAITPVTPAPAATNAPSTAPVPSTPPSTTSLSAPTPPTPGKPSSPPKAPGK